MAHACLTCHGRRLKSREYHKMTSAYLVADETLVNRKKNIYIEKYKATGGQQDCSALTAETLFCIWKPDNFFYPATNREMRH